MSLSPLPLNKNSLIIRTKDIIDKLASMTKDELITHEIEEILNWDNQQNIVVRRILRSYSIIYSEEELKELVSNDINRFLTLFSN